MAYFFDLETELPDAPFVDGFDVEIIEFALGYDVDADIAMVMSVMLVPGASYLDGELEDVFDLRFGIRERDLRHEWKVQRLTTRENARTGVSRKSIERL